MSVGRGLVHYVLLTDEASGRSVVDSRVIDVDHRDGLDNVGRVNAGIDVMLNAAGDQDLHVDAIGVATPSGARRRAVEGRGSGTRRQIRLFTDDESVAAYLAGTGEIDKYSSVLVVDCGDSGMSIYTVDPATLRTGDVLRSRALSGRRIDEAIARSVSQSEPDVYEDPGFRQGRRDLVSACRIAKEDPVQPESGSQRPGTHVAGVSKVDVTADMVADAVEPMIPEARDAVAKGLALAAARGAAAEAVVLVGGLAHIPAVQTIAAGHGRRDTIIPGTPELASAIGAARLAATRTATSRQAVIGGGLTRGLLSPMPLAVVAALLGVVLMTMYAVGTTLSGRDVAAPVPSATKSTEIPLNQSPAAGATTRLFENLSKTRRTTPSTHTETMRSQWADEPRWATVEVPQPEVPSTTTLSPEPYYGGYPQPTTTTLVPPPLRPQSTSPARTTPPTQTTTTPPSGSTDTSSSESSGAPTSSGSSQASTPAAGSSSESSGIKDPAAAADDQAGASTEIRSPAAPTSEPGTEVPEPAAP